MVRDADEAWRELMLWICLEARYQLAREAGMYPPRASVFKRYRGYYGQPVSSSTMKRNKMGGREVRMIAELRAVEITDVEVAAETMSRALFMRDYVYPA